MEAYIDRVAGKVFVKDNGEVKEASVSKRMLKADIVSEPTAKQIKQQELSQALEILKAKIIDAKEKAELVNLGIETQAELDRKTAEYKKAKTNYDDLKG